MKSFDQKLVDQAIESLLPKDNDRLSQAMRYSALSPGKRLRPFILLEVASMYGAEMQYSLRAAAAVEIIHSYSLIHDDLPAMDDDDFRRGAPSCHKQFDEATAILAGDCLLSLAFEILADRETHPDSSVRCNLIKILAENIGTYGMAGGQMLDIISEQELTADYSQLTKMHWMKTAKLFVACCLMGAELGKATEEEKIHLIKFAEYFGLAFQFADDLADIKGEKALSNNNVVKLLGEEKVKAITTDLIKKAREELTHLSASGSLDTLAQMISDN